MSDNNKKLRLQEQSQHHAEENQTNQNQVSGVTFDSVEDLLRADREQIETPPKLKSRLSESLSSAPAEKQNWWGRLLGRK